MTKSLNSVLPVLARILDEPANTLRTRQRALVAADALDFTPGRGPGSGVAANGKTLAQFLIGSCTGVEAAHAFARTRPSGGKCPLTGAKTFADALAAILSDKDLSTRVNQIIVGTSYGHAIIRYDGGPWEAGPDTYAAGSVVFGGATTKGIGLLFQATIPGSILKAIAKELAR